jgi:glycosyltransferase involved in cell wall biosynthesis
MRVLQVHNRYRPGWGGEDTVADLEADLLRRNNHEVERVSAWTKELDGASALRMTTAAFGTTWSSNGYSMMKSALARFSPDIVHVHNTFPLLSPSVLWAAAKAHVPVVYTLHNFRIACANGLLLRNDKSCEDCVGRFPAPALRHRCLSGSLPRTAAVTTMNLVHRSLGTFKNKVHAYIALNAFSKNIFERVGLPAERIHIKPNFTLTPTTLTASRQPQFVFVGQVARFKGIHLLLEAWRNVAPTDFRLVIVGDGEDRAELEERYRSAENIIWIGKQPRDKVVDLIAESLWVVLPSLAYENFPMSVVEAFSAGTPVIVSNHGALATMVSHEIDGLTFRPGDLGCLESTLRLALNSGTRWAVWSAAGREKYFRCYTDRSNYAQLLTIYQKAADICQSPMMLNKQQSGVDRVLGSNSSKAISTL